MNAGLEQLIIKVEQYTPHSEKWQLTLTRLVDEMLRTRKVARPLIGQPLFGIYKEIYEQVRQILLHDISEEVDKYKSTGIPLRVWVKAVLNQSFRKILDDQQLKNLAIEAQKHPPHSELRQYSLRELIEAIYRSGRLCHPHRQLCSPQLYELIYEEAVSTTLIYVCQKIDNYDPERGDKKFMNWVNFRLDKVFLDIYFKLRDPKLVELPSLSDLDKLVQPEQGFSLVENICEKIEEDPENLFKNAHIRDRPDANFQTIALARCAGKSWEEISLDFNISISTLSVFFQRCCKKFRSQLSQ
ncbi:hypothetical protein G7B40_033140 [Aetokthonos hydrillicola Thurmond2011]|jgi:DNA-directed RNA polymerase specialized sigma24 family protein|uniref:Sigma-70 family RNA polymerase sigma factor n=1 Tax=Aetokthonos hydrillicola Thurmond2011 TaxID=2712845 RepID=A0AAP5ID99_9CYAN|nr:sigma-70 family RNA polymerase sigma factor [Aetokthonos hydrillicola]MBO3459593.1 sigma-70 family RNA polymerase sigma factor [Aetokthonos hydrillicola CCALA 1050]MBW4590959.1 hypothetical protein [Aetokthonos hydrillicola CCALA 1050]MDR9899371.1 hypothetical protein [Aetokthonos hydrillicola Thurmond2011]